MNVSLREIDESNFRQVINLTVADEQKGFVASNARSIAQSKIYPHLVPLAVYEDGKLVGFAMYGRDPETYRYWIVRLMIDAEFQGKGYGRAATLALIKKMEQLPKCGEIFLSFVPDNEGAEKLYQSVGFKRTGERDEDGEIIMRFESK